MKKATTYTSQKVDQNPGAIQESFMQVYGTLGAKSELLSKDGCFLPNFQMSSLLLIFNI